ncbi:MAG TPA: hydroxyisourate hydrolase [Alphaproteobacteria bacterium]|jgi:5-hydroxyisourate hydrolase|nr:hydroxyisourate hydrolase [Alphaproteobacteria bacterium]MDP6269285.1 hydroxyisourate hydrolase [Alphaproteobacteria bacterium]HJM52016.1 hydroxyisourate hydrolase [Alphaproteobacteria bacterium]|tara:strand:- start:704 stop:1039 length:336 start_codon:yes stop_codon:yes gene_type:complete
MAVISSHVLDSLQGRSLGGVKVALFRLLEDGAREQVFAVTADDEGRISVPVEVEPEAQYELVFDTGGVFAASAARQIMDQVVIRLRLPDAEARYHIPVLLAPHSYTVWWSG